MDNLQRQPGELRQVTGPTGGVRMCMVPKNEEKIFAALLDSGTFGTPNAWPSVRQCYFEQEKKRQ
jgi:hypothetical protein